MRIAKPPARALAALLVLLAAAAAAAEDGAVDWRAPAAAADPVLVRILGINDLHGRLVTRATDPATGARVGGAAVLASYLAAERERLPRRTLLLIAGDSIGASALESGLLRDEPTMAVLNELADGDCPRLARDWPSRPAPVVTRCRVIATVGNHEFDRGTSELERLFYGGPHPGGALLGHDWTGSRIPFVVANVVRRDGQRPLLPSAAIVLLDGVRIGVVGAVTAETPGLVVGERIRDLEFQPEAAPINAAAAALRAAGVHAIVLVIHEGLRAPVTPGAAPVAQDLLQGRLAEVLAELDGGIDVVVAGHTHKLNNVLVARADGPPLLVVQARAYGEAYSAIELTIDRASGSVAAKSARVLPTWADRGPGRHPARRIAALVASASSATAPVESRPIGTAATALRRGEPAEPESSLGDLVADAQRAAAGTELAFMNAAGIRSDLERGPITYGALYEVQPFGNVVMRLSLTGEQVLRLLEQQFDRRPGAAPRFLRIAGLRYVYDLARPAGRRIVSAQHAGGQPLDPARRYTVAANDFIAGGGDFYSVLAEATDATPVVRDLEALESFIRAQPAPLRVGADGRAEPAAVPR